MSYVVWNSGTAKKVEVGDDQKQKVRATTLYCGKLAIVNPHLGVIPSHWWTSQFEKVGMILSSSVPYTSLYKFHVS